MAFARAQMIERQLSARGIRDERVLAAMAELPRELFIAGPQRGYAYADAAVPIEAGQTISQPYIVARMTELLAPERGQRVLEVGTGSGYQAAVLARLGCRVLSIERWPELARAAGERLASLGMSAEPGESRDGTVEVRVGDGTLGDPEGAPHPRIIVTAAAPRIPDTLRAQLADGGRMVVPVGSRDQQELLLVERRGDEWLERSDGPCVFVPLLGSEGFGPRE